LGHWSGQAGDEVRALTVTDETVRLAGPDDDGGHEREADGVALAVEDADLEAELCVAEAVRGEVLAVARAVVLPAGDHHRQVGADLHDVGKPQGEHEVARAEVVDDVDLFAADLLFQRIERVVQIEAETRFERPERFGAFERDETFGVHGRTEVLDVDVPRLLCRRGGGEQEKRGRPEQAVRGTHVQKLRDSARLGDFRGGCARNLIGRTAASKDPEPERPESS
jgi:hypothetical protein